MSLTTNNKLHSLTETINFTRPLKSQPKTTALITGCFDVLHIGHVELFRFVKTKCDVLIIGLESDATMKLSKGNTRPISTFDQRASLLSELVSVDLIFPVGGELKFGSTESDRVHEGITKSLLPDFLVITPATDKYWRRKIDRAGAVGAKTLSYDLSQSTSTSKIIDAILAEA